MSKKEKRVQKIRESRTNVSLSDFEALNNQYGYVKEGSKHPQAVIGRQALPYKRENPVKTAYVDEVLKMIDSFSDE